VTNGGDSGNRIFVLYWRCPLIRVSVIRDSTVFGKTIKTLQFKKKIIAKSDLPLILYIKKVCLSR
jgi:hypothetical protein